MKKMGGSGGGGGGGERIGLENNKSMQGVSKRQEWKVSRCVCITYRPWKGSAIWHGKRKVGSK